MTIADAIRRFREIVDRFPQAADWPLVMSDLEPVTDIIEAHDVKVVVITDEN